VVVETPYAMGSCRFEVVSFDKRADEIEIPDKLDERM
jgi:hypothetical protein